MKKGRCAGCKYLRRRCSSDCFLAPYFPSNNPSRFATVHRIYGANNVAKLLQKVAAELREEAAETLYYEAKCRVEDPVYGCVGIISNLNQQIQNAYLQLAQIQAQIAILSSISP